MEDIKQRLIDKSIEAFILGLEIYNKPTIKYRIEGFSFFIINAWELMLKATLLNRGESIYFPDKPDRTLSVEVVIRKIYTDKNTRIRLNLEKILELRNISTHYITEDYEIKYAPLLGFFIGLFNMIPYVGAIIAVAISAVITLITGGLTQAIWMLIVVIILQQIDANIINPKILGDGLKISPILVIFAVTIGGEFFGVIGMFLSVPVIAILKLLIVDFIEIREKKKKEQIEVKNL